MLLLTYCVIKLLAGVNIIQKISREVLTETKRSIQNLLFLLFFWIFEEKEAKNPKL